jgi:hypothetical protein
LALLAPVALFVYKRPEHTKRTLEALLDNSGFDGRTLLIFSDGPKTPADQKAVDSVRAICREVTGANVKIIESKTNLGLATSIITGVSKTVNDYGRVIVLEDDLVTSPSFLRFMDSALEKFKNERRVASIHGYSYPAEGLPESYFLRGADCWGWATWKRAWDLFEPNSEELLRKLKRKRLLPAFDFQGAYPFSEMLRRHAVGLNDSWAIRWHASIYLEDMLTLYPGRSLISNIGLDGSGSNSGSDDRWSNDLAEREPLTWPTEISPSVQAYSSIQKYLFRQMPFRKRLLVASWQQLKRLPGYFFKNKEV